MKSTGFFPAAQEVPRFGYVYGDIWAKLEIENKSNSNQETFFEFRGPIERVIAYLIKDSKVTETAKAGMFMYPEDESFVSGHAYPVIVFRIPPGASTVYFSETAVAPHFPIVSYDREGFENRLRTYNSILSLYFGFSIAFLFILVIIFFFVSGTIKVFLISSFLSFSVLMGFVTGVFRMLYFSYARSKSSIFSDYILLYPLWPLALSLFWLSISLFSIFHLGKENFFRTKTSRVLTFVAILSQFLLGAVSYFDTVLGMNIFSMGFNISIGQAIYWSVKKFRSERTKEWVFTILGWTFYGVFSTVQLFYFLGISDNVSFAV